MAACLLGRRGRWQPDSLMRARVSHYCLHAVMQLAKDRSHAALLPAINHRIAMGEGEAQAAADCRAHDWAFLDQDSDALGQVSPEQSVSGRGQACVCTGCAHGRMAMYPAFLLQHPFIHVSMQVMWRSCVTLSPADQSLLMDSGARRHSMPGRQVARFVDGDEAMEIISVRALLECLGWSHKTLCWVRQTVPV